MSHIREDPAGGQAANSPTAEIFLLGVESSTQTKVWYMSQSPRQIIVMIFLD